MSTKDSREQAGRWIKAIYPLVRLDRRLLDLFRWRGRNGEHPR
jgi:hypothetical protein